MSLNCLVDHIGIEGCGGDVPVSGLYINRLPGIELKALDKIASQDQANFQGVWEDIQERSVRRFRNEAIKMFKKRYKLKTITQSVDVERKIDTATTTASATEYRGYTLELNRENDEYVASNLQSQYIQTLPIYLSGAVNTTVKIYDLDTETQLFSLAVTGVQGWNIVRIDETFTARRIYVAYDATTVTSVEQDITKLRQAVLYGNDGNSCLCYSYSNLNIEIRGASSMIADKFNITYGNDTFGLSGLFSVLCSFDALICNNLQVFETPLWYLEAAEFCFERQFTSRLNEYTAFDKSKAKELREEYEKRFIDELETVIDGINLDLKDSCLECNEQFIYADAKL
jgi:hypothetical protein